jgi:hypothetical protein
MEIKKRFVRMSEEYNIDRSRMKALIEEFGGVDSYTNTQAVSIFELLFKMTREVGLDPEKSNEFFEVVSKVYNLEIHNLENSFSTYSFSKTRINKCKQTRTITFIHCKHYY